MTAEAAASSGAAFRARIAAAGAASGAARGALIAGACPGFAQLCAPPPWLLLPADERARLAERAALRLAAPGLARCLDGGVLGPLADAFGDEVLDAELTRALRAAEGKDAAAPALPASPASLDAIRSRAAVLLSEATRGEARADAQMNAAMAAAAGSA